MEHHSKPVLKLFFFFFLSFLSTFSSFRDKTYAVTVPQFTVLFQYLLKDLLIPHLLNATAIPLLTSIARTDVLIMENSLQEERNWHILPL